MKDSPVRSKPKRQASLHKEKLQSEISKHIPAFPNRPVTVLAPLLQTPAKNPPAKGRIPVPDKINRGRFFQNGRISLSPTVCRKFPQKVSLCGGLFLIYPHLCRLFKALRKTGTSSHAPNTAITALSPEVTNLSPQAASAAARPLPSSSRVISDLPRCRTR